MLVQLFKTIFGDFFIQLMKLETIYLSALSFAGSNGDERSQNGLQLIKLAAHRNFVQCHLHNTDNYII